MHNFETDQIASKLSNLLQQHLEAFLSVVSLEYNRQIHDFPSPFPSCIFESNLNDLP